MEPKAGGASFGDNIQKENEEYLYESLVVILKYRKIIYSIVGAVFVVSIIVSLILPKMYRATACVLAPQEASGGFNALLANNDEMLGNLAGDLIGGYAPVAQYIGILKSRTVANELNRKFGLMKLYGLNYSEDVNKELERRSIIEFNKRDQTISISVEDRDPNRAADIANAYIFMLDKINRKLSTAQGRRKRIFLEERLNEVRNDLEKAEVSLKSFQERYQIVAIEEQAKVTIKEAARIKRELISAKTELEVFKQFGTERQVEAFMLKTKIDVLEKQLDTIKSGSINFAKIQNDPDSRVNSNYFIPFDKIPEIGMQLMRLSREAKIQEKLFELLVSQYEKARIEEAKDVDTIQVLDQATPPKRRSRPNRKSIVIFSTVSAVFVGIFYAFYKEFFLNKFSQKLM
jgi:uncharacterized protein involved in exopolysaccharide biosynthesis